METGLVLLQWNRVPARSAVLGL